MTLYILQMRHRVDERQPLPATLAGLPRLDLGQGTCLVYGEEARAALPGANQLDAGPSLVRVATERDMPEVHGSTPSTAEIVAFVDDVRRRKGTPAQQPVATDRASALIALRQVGDDR